MKKHFIFLAINVFVISCLHANPVALPDTTNQKKDLVVTLKVLNESQIMITVKNVSKKSIQAYSHVKSDETHYDYFEIEAITPDNDRMYFSLYGERDKSAPVIVTLKPDESFSHTIDFVQWAERSINKETLKRAGLNYLPHGIKIRAKYLNSPCDNCSEALKAVWTGYVYSEWVDF